MVLVLVGAGGADVVVSDPRYERDVMPVASFRVQRQGEETDDFWDGFING